MGKRVVGLRFLAVLAGSVVAGGFTGLYAQGPAEPMNYDGAPGGVRYIEQGQPAVLVHATVDAMEKYWAANPNANAHARGAQSPFRRPASNNLSYHGGVGGIGVETAPQIYLVLWGSQWVDNDPSGEEALLESFLNGVSGSSWLNSVTQYCQGVASGTVSCKSGSLMASNQTGSVHVWFDTATAAPSRPRQSDLAQEAIRAAGQFGNTATVNETVQYVIATAHGNSASGFGTQYCAWHSSTSSPNNGNIAYTNLPYITDAGGSCGANYNGLGPNAGITIVEGHELAETITDQFPNGGWLDSSGEENGDKCAWISSGAGASQYVTLNGTQYPVQSLWSNASGGCVVSYP